MIDGFSPEAESGFLRDAYFNASIRMFLGFTDWRRAPQSEPTLGSAIMKGQRPVRRSSAALAASLGVMLAVLGGLEYVFMSTL